MGWGALWIQALSARLCFSRSPRELAKETHRMADLPCIYSPKELAPLSAKDRAALLKRAKQLVKTSSEIRNVIKKDPKICKLLKAELRPLYAKLSKD